ncbi:glutaminyl-peptide cyclotransferase [Sphingomonas sp.]|uniref:glutaminyl-peptide cyclotransferase n=1 Tax=Sphingomonas sp. TaxID=28214 RepID=UPI001B04277B|nr:glutaminyl-peptide cyclotransferase [Sphingomonas sp.]MBO9713697.1 glutaminyl-peptide cyclotransferase [Sphingomonas sp.]
MLKSRRNILILAGAILAIAVVAWWLFLRAPSTPPVYAVRVVKQLPHDPQAFTEGLFFQDGIFYESTGEVGASGVRKTKLETGEVLLDSALQPPYFGEGIVPWKDRLIQVTWKDKTGFVYNLKDFALRDSFSYQGEGWGMTQDGKRLILSDGTPTLRFLDPETLKQTGTLSVTAGGCPVKYLNELEWVNGEIYANIWQTSLIAQIDPATGQVKSFLDVSALGPKDADPDAVANGIAWDAAGKRLFVTGKYWPQLYQVDQGAKVDNSEAAAKIVGCGK